MFREYRDDNPLNVGPKYAIFNNKGLKIMGL